MIKAKTKSFILELKLNTNNEHLRTLDKRFEIARIMYNTTLKYAKKQLKRMRENKAYRKVLNQYMTASDKKEKKTYSVLLNSIRLSYGISEYQFHEYINVQRQMYKKHIDVNTAQKIATTVWQAVESVLFKSGKKLHFKKFGALTSLEGKSNAYGIRFKENILHWNGLKIAVKIRSNDIFAEEALTNHKVKYCRIIRKPFKNGYKYYLQLIMEGLPPVKRINSTGEFRHTVSQNDRVGLDIGTSSVAICSTKDVKLLELAQNVNKYEKDINRLYRKLQRSREATNPENFNPDGTIKKGIKLKWVRSKSYINTFFELKDMYRQKATYIKQEHNELANYILSIGTEVFVETMNFKRLQKRSKEITKNKNGKFNRKKRFGKLLNNKAPAMLISIIDRKLKYIDKNINKVNTIKFKASQYNHFEDKYIKKKLSQRWNYINNEKVQRDLYSAFLLMNSKDNLEETDKNLCLKEYEQFKENHDKQIKELKEINSKQLSSFGIK